MLKKVKKFTSLLLIAALILVFFIPGSADASIIGGNTGGGVIPPEDSVVHTYLGSEISNEVWTALEGVGVEMQADTIIQAVPMNEENDAMALTVTNVEGSLVTQEVFASFNEDGEAEDVVTVNANGNIELVYDANAVTIDPWVPAINVIFAYNCFYSVNLGYFCQPVSFQAKYMNPEYDVEYMDIRFICSGYEWTYPGLVNLSSGMDDVYSHEIRVTQSNPTLNRWYSTINRLRSDRVIELDINKPNPVPLGIHYDLIIDGAPVVDIYNYHLDWLEWPISP